MQRHARMQNRGGHAVERSHGGVNHPAEQRFTYDDLARAGAGDDRATLTDAAHVAEWHQDGLRTSKAHHLSRNLAVPGGVNLARRSHRHLGSAASTTMPEARVTRPASTQGSA